MAKTTVNSVSGGATSGYLALHYPADIDIFACVCINFPKAAPKDPTVLKYCLEKLNGWFIASAESETTLKALMQLEQLLGKEIVWVRGPDFDDVIDGAGLLPTWSTRFCTTELKIIPIFEYIYFRYGVVDERIGFRYDEFWRAFSMEKGKKPVKKVEAIVKRYPLSVKLYGQNYHNLADVLWAEKSYPLIDDRVDHRRITDFWKTHPHVKFPRSSNCQGCHHKEKALIKSGWESHPEILEWFSLQELKGKANATWHDDRVSYAQIREMNFTELLDFGGYGSCDSGGCTD